MQCEACNKWRTISVQPKADRWCRSIPLPQSRVADAEGEAGLPAARYCSMHPDAALASCDAPEEEFDTDEEEVVEPAMPLLSVLPPAATPSARQAAQLPEPDVVC